VTDYAIVLSHNRPDLLTQTVDAIATQVNLVMIVDNASVPPIKQTWQSENYMLLRNPEQPPNIARMWNEQFDLIAAAEAVAGNSQWNIACLCDDAPAPPGWFVRVSTAMRKAKAVAGSTHSYAPIDAAYTLTYLSNGVDRMCPWAFVIAGEHNLRADERMRLHFQDTDLDWQARQRGGTIIVPGPVVPNLRIGENPDRPEYAHIIHEDERIFNEKWSTA
jgi:hypothetical protein